MLHAEPLSPSPIMNPASFGASLRSMDSNNNRTANSSRKQSPDRNYPRGGAGSGSQGKLSLSSRPDSAHDAAGLADRQQYHKWVEDKFQMYRDEIALLRKHTEEVQGRLATVESERSRLLRRGTKEEEEDRSTIDKLERMVAQFRHEAQAMLKEHMNLQSAHEDTLAVQDRLKSRVAYAESQYYEITNEMESLKEKQAAELEKERATYRDLASEVKRLNEAMRNHTGDRDKVSEQLEEAVMEVRDLRRKHAEVEAACQRKIDVHTRLQKDLKEQISTLERAVETERRQVEKAMSEADRDAGSLEASIRIKERECGTLSTEVERLQSKLAAEREQGAAREELLHKDLEEAREREAEYRAEMAALQEKHNNDRTRISETMSLLISEKDRVARESLAAQLSEKDARGEVEAFKVQVDGLEAQLLEARKEIAEQHNCSLALEDNTMSTSAQMVELQGELVAKDSDLAKLQMDGMALAERLHQAHDDVRGLQIRLRQVEEAREAHKAASEQLERECADLQLRVAEKEHASASALLSTRDAIQKSDQLHQRLTELTTDRALLQERLEAAEYSMAQFKAERDAKDVEATRAQREKLRMVVEHAQQIEEIKRAAARDLAEATRKLENDHHAAILDEQRRRQQAVEEAHSAVHSDPRVLRATDLESKNAELLRQVRAAKDALQERTAEGARDLQDLASQLEQSRRQVQDLRSAEETLRSSLRYREESEGNAQHQLTHLHADFAHFVQSSETWLRELLMKVATLTAQRLHSEFLLGGRQREEVFGLRGQLRQTRLALEQVNEDFKAEQERREAAQTALEAEQRISKELLERQTLGSTSDLGLNRSQVEMLTRRRDPNSRSFGNRDVFISPERNSVPTIHGTLSEISQQESDAAPDQAASPARRANKAQLYDERFVLETREELVAALCKQEVRCGAVLEDATDLYQQWRAAMTTTEKLGRGESLPHDAAMSPARGGDDVGMVKTPHHQLSAPSHVSGGGAVRFRTDADVDRFTEKVVDVIEVTQALCAAHSDLVRSMLTHQERNFLSISKAAVA